VIGGHACREHERQERSAWWYAKRGELHQRLAESQGWICTWEECGLPLLPDERLEIDHIIPLSSGFAISEEWNLQVLHWCCNRSKGSLVTVRARMLAAEHGIELAVAA
jgi:5-methylcytosine-specific restriction endonuclease McrA